MGYFTGLPSRVSLWPAVLPSTGTACHSHSGNYNFSLRKNLAAQQLPVDSLKMAAVHISRMQNSFAFKLLLIKVHFQ